MTRLPPTARGQRFDHALRDYFEQQGHSTSVREVRQALKEGRITLDGRRRKPGERASGDEMVVVGSLHFRAEARPQPQPQLQVPIVFEDETLLVLDKPSGMPTVPVRADEQDTLLNAAVAIKPAVADAGPPLDAGAVHRLDTATSGLVMFAATTERREALRRAFTEHQIKKEYWACVSDSSQLVNQELRQHIAAVGPQKSRAVDVTEDGQLAVSNLDVWARREGRAWVLVSTCYGRRHQVRVQLASLQSPIIGDAVYGRPDTRLALHATRLTLPDGTEFCSPVPDDLRAMLNGWAP